MKILTSNHKSNNNVSFISKTSLNKELTINEKMKEKEKNNNKTNTIKFNSKDKKSKELNFLTSIVERNKEMQEQITDVKLKDFKHLMKLEDQKNNAIKSIKDLCKNNKDQLSQWNGISPELNDILSGNIDSVLDTMSFNNVNKSISNLEIGVIFDDLDGLKEYYAKGLDSSLSFTAHRKSKGEESTFDPKNLSDYKKGAYDLLETLKDSYKDLFRINDAIKDFKKDSKERLEEMQKNMEKISANNFKADESGFDNALKVDNPQKKNKIPIGL